MSDTPAHQRGRRTPTMADVAARAAVSHQTVSRVINGGNGVRPDTAERVRQAIADLGYRRNIAARVLASSRSHTIGVVTFGTRQFGPSQVMLALEEAARAADLRVVGVTIADLTSAAVNAALDQALEHSPEALVVIVPHRTALRIVRGIELDVPVLVVEGDLSRRPLTACIDNVGGARLAVRHLLDLGHTTIAHVAGPQSWAEAEARVDGWRDELESAGLEPPALRWAKDWSAASGYRLGLSLTRERDVTAVFATNDQIALGLMAAFRESGRQVPGDLSLVGFDDLPESPYFSPPLTTVRQDFAALGRAVVGQLEQVLAGQSRPAAAVVSPVLVQRASTAPPR